MSLVPVREPLVLISQVQRSGGTLLSQLFDGHPEYTRTRRSSTSAPASRSGRRSSLGEPPEAWFDALFERVTLEFIENGYSKTTEGARRAGTFDVFPFRFDPELQR